MTPSCIKRLTNTGPVRASILALRNNPKCRVGILADERAAFLENGINSYQNDKELLVLLSDLGNWWYGYVLRVHPHFPGNTQGNQWLAILVQSAVPVDGYAPSDIFLRARKTWFQLLEYLPYYVQHPEDGSALCPSFETALTALHRIIDRFDIRNRIAWKRDAEGRLLDPEGSILDTRCEDLFGLDYDNKELYEGTRNG